MQPSIAFPLRTQRIFGNGAFIQSVNSSTIEQDKERLDYSFKAQAVVSFSNFEIV